MSRRRLLAALGVAATAFALYRGTLLAGFDFGDTGSFQATVGSATITPRDGYPLYFAVGNVFVWALGGDPARALNLASAAEGAVACGLIVLAAAELAGSLASGVAVALLFAASYTFWSQAIIAEVYALHALFVALTLLLLLEWQNRPSTPRLALFFGAFALGFGNHLSMVLLLPGYTLFLLVAAPRGWRSMFAPRIVALALGLALAGALQYAWNIRALWLWPNHPSGPVDALQTFWFDVTKTDWRATTVLHVPESMLSDRVGMYLFEVRQQFGWTAVLAPIGLARLLWTRWRRGLLMAALYLGNAIFAFSYNVGDAHVFYLPSHLVLAFLAAPAIVGIGELAARVVHRLTPGRATALAALLLAAYAGQRMYRNYPALDRSEDHRPEDVLARLTAGLDDRRAVLLVDLNWQVANGFSYFTKETAPAIAYARMPDVLPYAPVLIRDNLAIGRQVVVTERARDELIRAYGPLFSTAPDPETPTPTLADGTRGLAPGTRYVLSILKPSREFTIDLEDLRAALRTLAGGRDVLLPQGDYAVVAGLAGQSPALVAGASRPFSHTVELAGVPVEVRMESWLAVDTIRRMGFGQIVAAHHHTLIVERGVSFAAFDASGRPLRTAYAASIFAPERRYLVSEGRP